MSDSKPAGRGFVPGDATRRYLRALAQNRSAPVDWSAAPPTFKRYPPEGRLVLPWRESSLPGDLLRGLLGVTRVEWVHRGRSDELRGGAPEVWLRRPAPSGGALYPIEAYVATGEPAGLYHYDAAHHALDLLNEGDHRPPLTAALSASPARPPDFVVLLAAVFWRNGFKYREFAYRLHCQETGVLCAQALAVAGALGLDTGVHLNFDDESCQRLLGLDPAAEGVLAVLTCSAGGRPGPSPVAGPAPGRCAAREHHPPLPVADRLPHLTALHAASSVRTAVPPRTPLRPPPTGDGPGLRLPDAPRPGLSEGLAARASPNEGFLPREIPQEVLAAILAHAAAGYPGDLPGSRLGPISIVPYVGVGRVSGVPAGVYRYQPDTGELVGVGGPGSFGDRRLLANTRLALPEAAVAVVPVGDQTAGIPAFGDRWYRLQQIETGLTVHRATLAAAAAGLTGRIHSDGTNSSTDLALGLSGGPLSALSFLLLGVDRRGLSLAHSLWPLFTA